MKKDFIKTLTAFLLLVAFALCTASCAQDDRPTDTNGGTGSPKIAENTENKENTGNTGNTENTENADPSDSTEGAGGLMQAPFAQGGLSLSGSATGGRLTCYLKLDGIEGDSRDSKHDKWIAVTDFSHSVERGVRTEDASGTYAPIVFTHTVDKATPKIQRCCMTRQWISSGTLQVMESVAGASAEVYTLELGRLRIVDSTVKNVTVNGANVLVEEVTLIAATETVKANDCAGSVATAGGLAYYFRLDGIDGESRDSAHKNWFDLADFSHGATCEEQSASDGSEFEPAVFTHRVGASTVNLQEYCFGGKVTSKGEFHVAKSIAGKAVVVYKVVLEEVRIEKVTVRTATDADGTLYLEEEVVLSAGKEAWTFSAAGLDDSVGGGTEANYDQRKKV